VSDRDEADLVDELTDRGSDRVVTTAAGFVIDDLAQSA
jgi:hypothetical protein